MLSEWWQENTSLLKFSNFEVLKRIMKEPHPTRIFKKPEELLQAFEEYKENVKEQSNEWLKVQYVGKEGDRKEDAQKVPLTQEGFYIFCRKNYGDVKEYFLNREERYNDFTTICTHIKEEIRNNQIIGGMLGFYNPSITQRLNNLKEQTDVTTNGQSINQLTPEQAKQKAKDLENDY
jgi:hypothetical protein